MKKLIYLFALLPLLIACNQNNNNTNQKNVQNNEISNALLPTKALVYNEVNYKNQVEKNWTKGVDSLYMDNLNNEILNSNITLYDATPGEYIVGNRTKITAKEVRNYTPPKGEISAIYFTEAWAFDSSNYKLYKTILKWSPVIAYNKLTNKDSIGQKAKKLLYDVESSFKGNEKLIASNITYEVNFNSEYKNYEWLDLEKLAKLIIDPVLKGKYKAYNFFNKNPLKAEDIKIALGYGLDSLEEEDPVTGEWKWKILTRDMRIDQVKAYIFVEDWYIDSKTYAIKKKIKTIAPIRLYKKNYRDKNLSKKVIFAIDFVQ